MKWMLPFIFLLVGAMLTLIGSAEEVLDGGTLVAVQVDDAGETTLEVKKGELTVRAAGRETRVAGLRRGVLEVTVANAVLLQELAHFHKRRLLEALRRRLPGTTITDLRFRAGVVAEKRG